MLITSTRSNRSSAAKWDKSCAAKWQAKKSDISELINREEILGSDFDHRIQKCIKSNLGKGKRKEKKWKQFAFDDVSPVYTFFIYFFFNFLLLKLSKKLTLKAQNRSEDSVYHERSPGCCCELRFVSGPLNLSKCFGFKCDIKPFHFIVSQNTLMLLLRRISDGLGQWAHLSISDIKMFMKAGFT